MYSGRSVKAVLTVAIEKREASKEEHARTAHKYVLSGDSPLPRRTKIKAKTRISSIFLRMFAAIKTRF